MVVTTPPACRVPPEGGNYRESACSFRLQAESRASHLALLLLLLLPLLSACGSHQPADDFTISTKVKIELLADPQLGALRLDVSTLNGIVTLTGTVPSQVDADRAAAAAKRVPGVRGVKPDLKIGG
jgi:hypothetical protein